MPCVLPSGSGLSFKTKDLARKRLRLVRQHAALISHWRRLRHGDPALLRLAGLLGGGVRLRLLLGRSWGLASPTAVALTGQLAQPTHVGAPPTGTGRFGQLGEDFQTRVNCGAQVHAAFTMCPRCQDYFIRRTAGQMQEKFVPFSLSAGACTGEGIQGTATQYHNYKYNQAIAKCCARCQGNLIARMCVEPLVCAYMGDQLIMPPWVQAIAQYRWRTVGQRLHWSRKACELLHKPMASGAVRDQETQPLPEVIRTGKFKHDPEPERSTAEMRRAQLLEGQSWGIRCQSQG